MAMTNLQRLQLVRDQVRHWLKDDLGLDLQEPPAEALLICDGYYCGRRFFSHGFSAVWFAEEGELKMYDADGVLLGVRGAGGVPLQADAPLQAAEAKGAAATAEVEPGSAGVHEERKAA